MYSYELWFLGVFALPESRAVQSSKTTNTRTCKQFAVTREAITITQIKMCSLVVLWKITDYTDRPSVSQFDNDTIFKDTWKMHKNVDNKIMNSIVHLRHNSQCSFFLSFHFTVQKYIYTANVFWFDFILFLFFCFFFLNSLTYPRVSFGLDVLLCYCVLLFFYLLSLRCCSRKWRNAQ